MPRKPSSPLRSIILMLLKHLPEQGSVQSSQHVILPPHLLSTDREVWYAYWEQQGQPWRTEPEIDMKRQQELTQHSTIVPDVKQGIYPFKGMKLHRADVEWLLGNQGPVDWNDKSQHRRRGIDLRGADLRHVDLSGLPLARLVGGLIPGGQDFTEERREMAAIQLEDAKLRQTHLEGAILRGAHLERANLHEASLQGANLRGAHLEGANLYRTQLGDAYLRDAYLQGANLSAAFLDTASNLINVTLSDEKFGTISLVDIHWGDVNLAVVKWSQIKKLGDEYKAKQKKHDGKVKNNMTQVVEHERAVRANRQLAVVLQNQGLNEDAARFAYRAQMLQRNVLWKQRDYWRWLFSMLLALLAGYGYRMERILVAYVIVVSICAMAYFTLGLSSPPHLSLLQAFLESITAFHGRVFSELFSPDTPQIWVSAFEAVAGLVIEGVFVAMLTQRFFSK